MVKNPNRRHRFDFWVKKIPQRRKWQPTPVFFPWEMPWTEAPGGQHSMGLQRVGRDLAIKGQQQQQLRGFHMLWGT